MKDLTNFLLAYLIDEPYGEAILELRLLVSNDQTFRSNIESIFTPFLEGHISAKKVYKMVRHEVGFVVENEEDAVAFLRGIYQDIFKENL